MATNVLALFSPNTDSAIGNLNAGIAATGALVALAAVLVRYPETIQQVAGTPVAPAALAACAFVACFAFLSLVRAYGAPKPVRVVAALLFLSSIPVAIGVIVWARFFAGA
jgi:hypothetical protein